MDIILRHTNIIAIVNIETNGVRISVDKKAQIKKKKSWSCANF